MAGDLAIVTAHDMQTIEMVTALFVLIILLAIYRLATRRVNINGG